MLGRSRSFSRRAQVVVGVAVDEAHDLLSQFADGDPVIRFHRIALSLAAKDSVPPEVPEPIRTKLGVFRRMLDVAVAEVVLKGSGIVAIVSQFVAAGMAKHVRMDLKRHPTYLA